ncbi:MAG: hypothetical protein WC248_04220, partial [Candidatus Methanomethylophilaceae archaeon]
MLSSHHPRLGGPIPKFTDYHLWKALMSLDESRPLGRKKLSITLNIGEGSTRTVLDILSEQEFISIDKNGVILTDKGADARDMVYMEVSPITTKSLTINDYDCA